MKHLTVELIPDPELGGFTARVPDIPAYGEGATEEEAISDLREALAAYIEEFGNEDATTRTVTILKAFSPTENLETEPISRRILWYRDIGQKARS